MADREKQAGAVLTIDLGAIRANYRFLCSQLAGACAIDFKLLSSLPTRTHRDYVDLQTTQAPQRQATTEFSI